VPGHAREFSADIQRVAARIGLEHRACWLQVVAQTAAEWARNTVQLLLAGPPRERPDALLIADDNLVEHATAGVIAAGLRAPEDVEIVAHCNFPWPAPSVLPARRLGYDTGELLFVCLGLLERQRRGEAVPDCTRLAPRFEDELRTASEHTPRV
jgi:DNA-binding LacI/PurR family transcriptional regulator